MKIAVLSDIHGNHFALQTVLNRAKLEKVDQLLILGDFIGYYYHPDKVLELIQDWTFHAVKGNHERILKGIIDGDISLESIAEKYGSGHEHALKKLSKKQIDFLLNLPQSLSVEINGCVFQLCHGSPMDPDQYIYPDTSAETLQQCNVDHANFVLIGHSHYQFFYRNTNSTLVNVGSVGQSRSKGGIAQWALINTDNMCMELRSTPYDTKKLIKQCSNIDPKVPYLIDILTRN